MTVSGNPADTVATLASSPSRAAKLPVRRISELGSLHCILWAVMAAQQPRQKREHLQTRAGLQNAAEQKRHSNQSGCRVRDQAARPVTRSKNPQSGVAARSIVPIRRMRSPTADNPSSVLSSVLSRSWRVPRSHPLSEHPGYLVGGLLPLPWNLPFSNTGVK